MQRQFPSIGRADRDQIGYEFNDELGFFRTSDYPVARWALEYYTGGHGMIKHAPSHGVQPEHFTDYLYSLLSYIDSLTDVASRAEFLNALQSGWPETVATSALTAAYAVRYDENKIYRYFELRSFKVSAADSKRFDKRWKQIPSYANGSVGAIVGLICERTEYFRPFLQSFSLYVQVTDFLRREKNAYVAKDAFQNFEHLQSSLTRNAEYAYAAVDALVEANHKTEYAARLLESHRRTLTEVA